MALASVWSRFHSGRDRFTPSHFGTVASSAMTPVSSPMSEFGIVKVEQDDTRSAQWVPSRSRGRVAPPS